MITKVKKSFLLFACLLMPLTTHSWPWDDEKDKKKTNHNNTINKIKKDSEEKIKNIFDSFLESKKQITVVDVLNCIQLASFAIAAVGCMNLAYQMAKMQLKLSKFVLEPDTRLKIKQLIVQLFRAAVFGSPEFIPLSKCVTIILELPWNTETTDNLNIQHIKNILDEEHYGMETTKKRILTFMATKILYTGSKPPILCFIGEPGLGKTTLAQSIAKALGRKQCKIALGGLSDVSKIRGSQKQWIGSKPGEFVEELHRAQSKNPVFVLDEIDKISKQSLLGDPTAALLEALDPEQNKAFKDIYIEVPFDLSSCFFIATANYIEDIPAPLRDRMEFIHLEKYSSKEKLHIAQKHLVPKILKETGLDGKGLLFTDEILLLLIEGYTQEAGVRNLQRIIKQVCSQVAYHYLNAKELLELTPLTITSILGKKDNEDTGTLEQKLRTKVKNLHLDREREIEIIHKIDQLAKMPPMHHEYPGLRTYIELFVSLPWNKETIDNYNLKEIKTILDADHSGFNAIKEQILNFIATQSLNRDNNAPILCFVGAPGIGKTSLAQSIAKALGRKSAKIALGGVSDPHELRGHIRTYVGAKPGSIIEGLRKSGSSNPVFVLDEIDKIGRQSQSGDPTAALLEILDPAQNKEFRDHFLDEPFDLSKVLFIATANSLEDIPAPLLNRMEVIQLSGYCEKEKLHIAQRHLVPKAIKETGLEGRCDLLSDEMMALIINDYTLEAGVRSLEREIKKLYAAAARYFVENGENLLFTPETIRKYLGPKRKGLNDSIILESQVGITNGLAYTQVGGMVLKVEALLMPGTGKLQLTGKLGDVMQESAKAALSYVRAHATQLGIDPKKFTDYDLHIHFPAGAIPKDGPSAGMALVTSIVSACTNRPVNGLYAMTGEINLRGHVTAIGGVKEKILGAKRMGITHVFVPYENKSDVEEAGLELFENIQIIYAQKADDVLKAVLLPAI